MLIYALIFLAADIVGMRVLRNVLVDYEQARPQKVIESYVLNFDRGNISSGASDFLDSLDENLHSRDESIDIIMSSLGEISYKKNSAASTQDRIEYIILSNGASIGTAAFAKEASENNYFGAWSLESQSFAFDELKSSASAIIPDDWSLVCGEYIIPRENIIHTGIKYNDLDEFYADNTLIMPTRSEYFVDGFIGRIKLNSKTPDGMIVEISDNGISEEDVLDNCTEEEKTQILDFLNGYFEAYIRLYSSSGDARIGNFAKLDAFLVNGGELEKRLRSALDGLYWSHSTHDELKNMEANRLIRLENGYYIADITNTVDTHSGIGTVTQSLRYKMLIIRTDNGLKAAAMYTC